MKLKNEAAIYAIVDKNNQIVKKPGGNRFYVSEFHAKKQCDFDNDPDVAVYHKHNGGKDGPFRVVKFRIMLDETYGDSSGGA